MTHNMVNLSIIINTTAFVSVICEEAKKNQNNEI